MHRRGRRLAPALTLALEECSQPPQRELAGSRLGGSVPTTCAKESLTGSLEQSRRMPAIGCDLGPIAALSACASSISAQRTVAGLEELRELRKLDLSLTPTLNLSPLSSCTRLRTLDLGHTAVRDLTPTSSTVAATKARPFWEGSHGWNICISV
jgi:hypothetical protein